MEATGACDSGVRTCRIIRRTPKIPAGRDRPGSGPEGIPVTSEAGSMVEQTGPGNPLVPPRHESCHGEPGQ